MPQILFVKTSSLGDVIHHCPAVSDAARNIPGIEVDWLVEEAFVPIARMHPNVRRAIPVQMRRWRASLGSASAWREMRAMRATLRARHYDAVIDTQGLLKSAVLGSLASGPMHGMDWTSAREPLASLFYGHRHAVPRNQHAVERNRQLTAAALGYAAGGDCSYGLLAARTSTLAIDSAYAVLLTMTSRADKRWPDAHWIRAGHEIAARGVRCVLPWGTEAERVRAETIARDVPRALVPSRLALEDLGALFQQACAVLGVDTGLTHLAVALGAPVIGIYCASDPALTGLHGSPRAHNLGGIGQTPDPARVIAVVSKFL